MDEDQLSKRSLCKTPVHNVIDGVNFLSRDDQSLKDECRVYSRGCAYELRAMDNVGHIGVIKFQLIAKIDNRVLAYTDYAVTGWNPRYA